MDNLYRLCKREVNRFVGCFVHYSFLKVTRRLKCRSKKITTTILGKNKVTKKYVFELRLTVRVEEDYFLLKHMLHSIGTTIILRENPNDVSTEVYSSESGNE